MRMNWLKIIVGFSAILIAGCAAFFSVTGLGLLFSGASLSVMIMAGSLEFAKIVTATYLKQQWSSIKGINKWYLTLSVGILMLITSAGIFGYLSNAFQQQNLKLDQVQREISVWETKIKTNQDQITILNSELTNLQSNQGKLIDNGNVNRSLLKSVDNRDKQVGKLTDKINKLQDDNSKYNEQINNIKNQNIGTEREIGGFRFVAEAFNIELKKVVKYFIFLIVFVFDPLAIALVIAFNQLILTPKKEKEEVQKEEPIVPEPSEIEDKKKFDDLSRIHLSEEDLTKLEKLLSNPPKPNDDLKKADEEYKNIVEETKPVEQIIPQVEEPQNIIVNEEPIKQEEPVIPIQPEVQLKPQEEIVYDIPLPSAGLKPINEFEPQPAQQEIIKEEIPVVPIIEETPVENNIQEDVKKKK
jgi:cell division protein FtsB